MQSTEATIEGRAAAESAGPGRHPFVRSLADASLLGLALCGLVVLGLALLGNGADRTVTNFLVNATAVAAMCLFIGNSGLLSFGHVAFMGVGAYAGALLVTPVEIKASALPDLPAWLGAAQLDMVPALLVAVAVAGLVAFLTGAVFVRMDAAGLAIASLSLLIATGVVLRAADHLTRGKQTFYGVPPVFSVAEALAVALVVLLVARLFRDSRYGLLLRATREDELASRSSGVPAAGMRLVAWTISGAMMGAAGFVLGASLGAFSPDQFSFSLTFLLIAMLIVGGVSSVTGAIAGAAFVTVVLEVLEGLEGGFSVGPVGVGEIFGLPQLGLGLAILATMYVRPQGLLGDWELRLPRRRRRERSR